MLSKSPISTTKFSFNSTSFQSIIPLTSAGSGGTIEAPKQGNLTVRIQGNHWDDGFFVATGPDNINTIGEPDKVPFKVLRNGWVGVGNYKPRTCFDVNNDVTGADSSFVVTTGGNIGIGTAVPTNKLELQGGGIRN